VLKLLTEFSVGVIDMHKLTYDNFIKARDFIMANGADIDRAWFRYHFESENETEFLRVLSKHQHEKVLWNGF